MASKSSPFSSLAKAWVEKRFWLATAYVCVVQKLPSCARSHSLLAARYVRNTRGAADYVHARCAGGGGGRVPTKGVCGSHTQLRQVMHDNNQRRAKQWGLLCSVLITVWRAALAAQAPLSLSAKAQSVLSTSLKNVAAARAHTPEKRVDANASALQVEQFGERCVCLANDSSQRQNDNLGCAHTSSSRRSPPPPLQSPYIFLPRSLSQKVIGFSLILHFRSAEIGSKFWLANLKLPKFIRIVWYQQFETVVLSKNM